MPKDEYPNTGETAADHAHGTHGKGDGREKLQDEARVKSSSQGDHESPRAEEHLASRERDREAKTGQMGDAGWGSEGSGGSVIDRRSPDGE